MEHSDFEEGVRPAKRARSEADLNVDAVQGQQQEECSMPFLSLPDGVLHQILLCLASPELFALNSVCRYFKDVTHGIAKEKLLAEVGHKQAARWRGYNWLQRLLIEETATKFDLQRGEAQFFTFLETTNSKAVQEIRLDQPGPRLLLSDVSTAQASVLRWKLQLRGNNAAEFGVVPVDMQSTGSASPQQRIWTSLLRPAHSCQDHAKALHKCIPNPMDERATGFSSAITVGSLLPVRLPIMKDTVVEILVTPREISFIIHNPEDGAEMVWQNNSTVSRPYKGPLELRLQLPNDYQSPVKLAVTAWQRAAFDVLHMLSPQDLVELQQQRTKAAQQGMGCECKGTTRAQLHRESALTQ